MCSKKISDFLLRCPTRGSLRYRSVRSTPAPFLRLGRSWWCSPFPQTPSSSATTCCLTFLVGCVPTRPPQLTSGLVLVKRRLDGLFTHFRERRTRPLSRLELFCPLFSSYEDRAAGFIGAVSSDCEGDGIFLSRFALCLPLFWRSCQKPKRAPHLTGMFSTFYLPPSPRFPPYHPSLQILSLDGGAAESTPRMASEISPPGADWVDLFPASVSFLSCYEFVLVRIYLFYTLLCCCFLIPLD